MSLQWNVTKNHSGGPDRVTTTTGMESNVFAGDHLATLKKGDDDIAEYVGPSNVKDEEIIEHAKFYYGTKKGLKLYMKNTKKFYEI